MSKLGQEPCAEKTEKYDDWQVEDALRTIVRAEEIQQDEKLMKLVSEKIKEQKEMLDKIEVRKSLFYSEKGEKKG